MSTLVSCILPVFNCARFVGEALDSVFAQTHRAMEVIVVDDGSTDDLAGALSRFGDTLTYVRRANGGPAAARNTGIKLAHGEYVAFLDADDLWHPEKLQRQLARFQARAELELSLCHQRVFYVESMRAEEERLRREKHPFVEDHAGYVCQAMLMRRSTFDRVGPFDETMRIGEDTEWLGRAQSLGVVREILEDVLFFRRLHEANLSYSRFSTEGARDRLHLAVARIKQRRQNGA